MFGLVISILSWPLFPSIFPPRALPLSAFSVPGSLDNELFHLISASVLVILPHAQVVWPMSFLLPRGAHMIAMEPDWQTHHNTFWANVSFLENPGKIEDLRRGNSPGFSCLLFLLPYPQSLLQKLNLWSYCLPKISARKWVMVPYSTDFSNFKGRSYYDLPWSRLLSYS